MLSKIRCGGITNIKKNNDKNSSPIGELFCYFLILPLQKRYNTSKF